MPAHHSPGDFAEVYLPTSAPGSPVASEQNTDLTSNSRFPRPAIVEEQKVLHLVPCSWEEFLLLEQPVSGYYDYVDGLVTHQPNMGDAGHCTVGHSHATTLECSDRALYIYMTPSVQVLSEKRSEWTIAGDRSPDSRNRGSSSTSTEPARQSFGLRHPDFAITKARRDSDSSDSSVEDPIIKRKVKFYLPYKSDLLALVEITSDSTRDVDLYTKWTAYARSGIPWYIILDRGTATYPRQVIVGSLTKFSDAKKSTHGDPDESRNARRAARSTSGSSSSLAQTYYKKVYKPDDIVDCPYYSTLNKTAKELLDEKLMSRHARKVFNDRAKQKDRAKQAEAELREAQAELREAQAELKEERRRRKAAEARATKAEAGPSSSSPTNSPVKKKPRK